MAVFDGAQAGMDNCLQGVVEFVSYLGAVIDIHIRLSEAERVVAQVPNRADGDVPGIGDQVYVGWPTAHGIVFGGTSAASSPQPK